MAEDEARVTTGGWRWPLGPIRVLIIATAVLSVVFLVLPTLDLWFSRQFYDAEIGFPALRIPALQWLRDVAGLTLWVMGAIVVVSLLAKLLVFPRRRPLVPGRAMLFLSATLALSAGLVVNGILKSLWGRPRPTEVIDFGGDAPFITAWHISDYCARNCSFVSGEASSSIWLVAVAFVVPARFRRAALATALALAFAFSLNRIAFGGHFLSDVLLAWTLTLLIIAAAYHLLYIRPPRFFEEAAIDGALTRAGLWLRALFARRKPAEAPLHPEAVAVLTGAATVAHEVEHAPVPGGLRPAGRGFAEASPPEEDVEPEVEPIAEGAPWTDDVHRDVEQPEEAPQPSHAAAESADIAGEHTPEPAEVLALASPRVEEVEETRGVATDLISDAAELPDSGNIESIDPEPEETPPDVVAVAFASNDLPDDAPATRSGTPEPPAESAPPDPVGHDDAGTPAEPVAHDDHHEPVAPQPEDRTAPPMDPASEETLAAAPTPPPAEEPAVPARLLELPPPDRS